MPAPCIPVVMVMNADAVLLYSPCARFGRGTLLEALSTITNCWLSAARSVAKTPRGREASVGLEFEGRERCAEAGAQKSRRAKNQERKELGALATVPEERTRQRNNEQS
jgi:hypothetical protein